MNRACLALIRLLGLGLSLLTTEAVAEDSPLSLADLEAYRAALNAKPTGSAPRVTFRDLWDRSEAYAGQMVQVEGRVARIFRQPRFQDFPPLVEIWVVSTVGDPFCLVCPQPIGEPIPTIGVLVRFSGTYLRRIQYDSGDVPRLAPLMVGPSPPTILAISLDQGLYQGSTTEWWVAGVLTLVVVLILAGRHYARPSNFSRPLDPPPLFVDGGSDFEGNLP